MAGKTQECLVTTTAAPIPATPMSFRTSVEIQNLGPNPIYCGFSASEAVNSKARKLATGETWVVSTSNFTIYAVTTVNQVSGAATIVTEIQ